jgi:hypothetical protein
VYLLDLESLEDTFMVAVCWTYPQDDASALLKMPAVSSTPAPTPTPMQLESLQRRAFRTDSHYGLSGSLGNPPRMPDSSSVSQTPLVDGIVI